MISKKELGYVNSWANKVPYPGLEYSEEAINKLVTCFELYKKEYQGIKYNITFSNNEEIEFEILTKNICHMLGIDHSNLTSDFFKDYRRTILDFNPEQTMSSFELLNSIVYNIGKVLNFDLDHAKKGNNIRALNYYKISIKCDIFTKMANLSDFNYGCINFNKEKYEEKYSGVPFSSKSTKFFYTPSNEVVSPYYMMGIRIDEGHTNAKSLDEENSDNYIVETLLAPEDIKLLFDEQEAIIPTQILIDNNSDLTKLEATNASKIKLLKEYRSIINEYKLSDRMNIYGDYLSLLMNGNRQDQIRALSK